MRIRAVQAVFDWASLEDSPSLGTIRRRLQALPDAALLRGLRTARGRGRDDYPVTALWGVAVLTPLLRHPSHEACLAELRRNPPLRRLIGIEDQEQIPHHWNLSRFLDVLGHPAHLAAMHAGFDRMVQRLGGGVPNLGHRLASDATALNARRGGATARSRRPGWGCLAIIGEPRTSRAVSASDDLAGPTRSLDVRAGDGWGSGEAMRSPRGRVEGLVHRAVRGRRLPTGHEVGGKSGARRRRGGPAIVARWVAPTRRGI